MKRYVYKMSDLRGLAARTKMIGVTSTAGVITALVASSVVQATDLQIYTVPTAGQKTIVMMIDTSGSMNFIKADYGVCGDSNSETGTDVGSSTSLSDGSTYKQTFSSHPYKRRYCYVKKDRVSDVPDKVKDPDKGCEKVNTAGTIYRCYDRLTRLKDGMFAFLNSNNPVLKNVYVGLGQFPIGSGTEVGKILVPAQRLGDQTSAHRTLLKTKVADLTAVGGTPTAAAFAEAAAYLLGTNTVFSGNILKDFYKENTRLEDVHDYYQCNTSPYSYLSGNRCYQSGFSGNYTNPTTGNYHCNFETVYTNYRSFSTGTRNRCYKPNVTSGSDFVSASNLYCNNVSYKYYNSADQKCYQNNTGYNTNNYIDATSVTKIENVTRFYQCNNHQETDYFNSVQFCNGRDGVASSNWTEITRPSNLTTFEVEGLNSGATIYKKNELQNTSNDFSGFDNSDISTKEPLNKKTYQSPLPDVTNRQSCDGQGVYILSDGEPTSKDTTKLSSAMKSALKVSSFSCSESGALANSNNWSCMSIFAKKLFNGGLQQTDLTKATNIQNAPVQTAFVGFSSSFSSVSNNTDVLNACKLSSRTQADRVSNDTCSPVPNSAGVETNTNAVATPGFGNGGFFAANTADEVTDSVIQFINNLGVAPLDPLSTGAISVPVDALNPSGYQPFGYLRALEPNPAMPVKVWMGNLKKYSIENGALVSDAVTVFDPSGMFNENTKDMWNTTGLDDGGLVRQGGVYSQLPMPTNIIPDKLRNLLTDVALNSSNTPVKMTDYSKPLLVVPQPTGSQTTLDAFTSQSILKDFSTTLKVKLLNYLGYDLDLTTNDILPTSLTAPNNPFISMGGSIHSFPVQLTYSGDLDSAGNLTDVRKQSVLYGSMEGALRIVDAETGEEQMAFVPADILLDTEASRALRLGEGGNISHGVSGAWVADPTYRTVRSSKKDEPSTIEAKTMNVYGGLRMGGESYYGLDALDPKVPKVLFRIGSDQADYARMGQTWSKPVLINVRHNGKIKRAMVVGGGYDMCYENPRFKLNTANPIEFQIKNAAGAVTDTCAKAQAKGNAIYVVDATSGEKLWWASNATSDTSTAFYNSNPNLKHSIVSRISTIDRDGDGLIDHLYFGDLGGQVFRADLDNKQNLLGTVDGKDLYSPFGVRVTRMANLGQSLKTDDSGELVGSADVGDSPRFYQAPTVTIHDQGTNTFIAVTIASGDRSTPLDVTPTQGRESMLPSVALTNRPVNNVYSIFDHDFIKKTLITGTVNLVSKNLVLGNLQKDPQLLADGTYIPTYFTESGIGKYGWYRSLSSQPNGTELAGRAVGGVTRVAGGVKAFEEEPIAISNNFFVPIYDPQGNSIAAGDPCKPRIVGESNRQQYCLPYGVCLTAAGYKNTGKEDKTGFQLVEGKNANVLGAGIRGISLGPSDSSQTGGGKNSCGSLTLLGNIEGAGQWDCQRIFNPTRWYEKYVTAK